MVKVTFGRQGSDAFQLSADSRFLAVRKRMRANRTRSASTAPRPLEPSLRDATLVNSYPEAGVEVYHVPESSDYETIDDRKRELRENPDVRFAGSVLVDERTRAPVLYTENLTVKFLDSLSEKECLGILSKFQLVVKGRMSYARNGFFVAAPDGIGQKVFALANRLLKRRVVEYCHPELIRPRAKKQISQRQWHLKETVVGGQVVAAHVHVEAAHQTTRGENVTIAVIDDGIDVDHPEFQGAGKVVAPRDATRLSDDPRPQNDEDNHGTACAGVACANGDGEASGVAPRAKLMPIRLASGLGSEAEAQAITWAVENGADVISCSWGPTDGDWKNPDDPLHQMPGLLPAHTRLALENAVRNGRDGKGCVICFAAGNGGESVDLDEYASHESVLAIAACNDRGERSAYSDHGRAVWCCFPSSDVEVPGRPTPRTPGIWTTDRRGDVGFNRNATTGVPLAYCDNFGGTSSACPGAAGVAALILSVNPALRWTEVKEILRRCCDPIDQNGGAYDASGRSPYYGFGRLNALTAVRLATPQPRRQIVVRKDFQQPIRDKSDNRYELEVADASAVDRLELDFELTHASIFDLRVSLIPPAAADPAREPIRLLEDLHVRGPRLKRTFDEAVVPSLSRFRGRSCAGIWVIQVEDRERFDAGQMLVGELRLVLP